MCMCVYICVYIYIYRERKRERERERERERSAPRCPSSPVPSADRLADSGDAPDSRSPCGGEVRRGVTSGVSREACAKKQNRR